MRYSRRLSAITTCLTYDPKANGDYRPMNAYCADMKREVAPWRGAENEIHRALPEVRELKNRLEAKNIYLQEEIRPEHDFEEMIGNSPALMKVPD
jgi:hypothetical protein